MINSIGAALVSGMLTLLAILALRPLAVAVDLIDRPGGRKTHHGDVPIVGGLAMFFGMVCGLGFLAFPGAASASFEGPCALLVVVGLLDDRFELSPWIRLAVHAAAALLVTSATNVSVTDLGDPLGIGGFTLSGGASIAFTVFVIAAAINGFNMMDGLDGLAGATAALCLAAFATVAMLTGADEVAFTCLVVIGAVCGFLVFNFPSQRNRNIRCFMGDAGSTLLGFTLAWIAIRVSQEPAVAPGARSISPIVVLWILALPLGELCWSTLRRLIRRTSPFSADSTHFHHLLMNSGFGVRGTFFIAVLISLFCISIGLFFWYIDAPDPVAFLSLLVTEICIVRLMYRPAILQRFVPKSFRRLPEDPNPTGKWVKPTF